MSGEDTAAVLFADVVGGADTICLEKLREATTCVGGEVVKTIRDEVMSSFPTPDAAAAAASRMQSLIEALSGAGRARLRVGFQAGPVIRRDGDVFGDTVNMAARLAEQASPGQILTSRETAELLSPAIRNSTRLLYTVGVKGKSNGVVLCELLWHESPDITDVAGNLSAPATRLRLAYRGGRIEVPEAGLVIGRDRDCDLAVEGDFASRRHCTITARNGKFIVQDHSANGTYVAVEGEGEIVLQREDFLLRGHGWIAFGQPHSRTDETLEYFCDWQAGP